MRLLSRVDKLILKTKDQKDALMGASFDIFLQLEKDREILRSEIERLTKEEILDTGSAREYKKRLEMLIALEKNNRRLLGIWKKRFEEDRVKLHKDKAAAQKYYNRDRLREPNFNRVI